MTLDLQPHRNRDGSIDLDFYKARAARLREEAIAELMGAVSERAVDWIGRVQNSINWSRSWVRDAGRSEAGQAPTILARDGET
jgi:hypothetical protein